MQLIERRPGECIDIGEEIEVRVLGIDGDRVRLGVIAPRDFPVAAAVVEMPEPALAQVGAATPVERAAAGTSRSGNDEAAGRGLPADDDSV